MKKILTVLLILVPLVFVTEVAYAMKNVCSNGIYDLQYDAVYIDVERTVTLSGDAVPDDSIYWKEIVNGHNYAGTLYLENFYVQNNVTMALYVGQLRKIN